MSVVLIQIRMLGPWEVRVEGRSIELSNRLRVVLAALAMSAGRPVPVDHLIVMLWDGDDPGLRPRRTVQTYIARLRRAIGAATIISHPAGYILDAALVDVDALRFTALVGAGDPGRERENLAEAAGLWRGVPFEGLDPARLHEVYGAALIERRLAAVERRVDLDIRDGDPAECVAELLELTALHPSRESLWARLLDVLRRCGRHAEALERYETVRRHLAEELGADPGGELRAIHAALLAGQDPGVPARHRAPDVVPRQLPPDLAGFTGRRDALGLLDPHLSTSAAMPLLTITGPPGVGKTTLAVHWGHQVAARFPDGQLYADLRGHAPSGRPRRAAEVVGGFLEALGVRLRDAPVAEDARFALYRSLLADRSVLVVLDNAREAEQVRRLLPGSARCLTVVTSRERLTGLIAVNGARPVVLDVLSAGEARSFLERRLGTGRVRAEPEATTRVIGHCARLPLALAVAAARAALRPRLPMASMASELESGPGLDGFADNDLPGDVRSVFSWSYHPLSPAAARLFRLLGTLSGTDVNAVAAANLAGVAESEAHPLLRELTAAALLADDGGRYRHHDLLRVYAAERSRAEDTDSERRAALGRLLDHYLRWADAASRALDPNREPVTADVAAMTGREEALAWFATEYDNLQAATVHAGASGFPGHARDLAWTLLPYQSLRGRWDDAVAAHLAAVGAVGDRPDPVRDAVIHARLARLHAMLENEIAARREISAALNLVEGAGPDARGTVDQHAAQVYDLLGDHESALRHAESGLARVRGRAHLEARALNQVGWFQANLGDLDAAALSCGEALAVNRVLGNRLGEASTLHSLGLVHRRRGDLQEAARYYAEAAECYRGQDVSYSLAVTLRDLGEMHAQLGRTAGARAAWEESATIFAALGRSEARDVEIALKGLS
ncbi:BTAD domain-containing putative transcriptional regulator [Phytomonospora sp. NPDC050363]|uniref:AfsR/SARP family transcriptional regulator n=1 Tax=Phytomonospora sp. NPDC050363 TaxID=3155642 RepID=UPI0033C68DF9